MRQLVLRRPFVNQFQGKLFAAVVFHIKWNRFPRLFGCLKSGIPGLRQLIVTKQHAWITQNMVLFALN